MNSCRAYNHNMSRPLQYFDGAGLAALEYSEHQQIHCSLMIYLSPLASSISNEQNE